MFKPFRPIRRRGFTLVELLVVIAIIGILIAPAAAGRSSGPRGGASLAVLQQSASSSAWPPTIITTRLGICRLALAIIQPPATACLAPTRSTCCDFSKNGNLYDRSLGSVPFPPTGSDRQVHYPGNNNVYSQPVQTFLCPSDPSVESGGVVTIDGITWGALCYAAQCPGVRRRTTSPPARPPTDPQGRTRFPDDFADGTSNTILHAEKYARCANTDMAPPFRDGGTAWAYCTTPLFAWQPQPMVPPGKAFQPGFAIAALVGPRRTQRHWPRVEIPGPARCFWASAIRHGPRRRTPAESRLAWPTAASVRWLRASPAKSGGPP